jgi:anti-anti-sigma regulatory factor
MGALQSSVPPPRSHPDDTLVLRLDGVFDGASAWDLRHTLERATSDAPMRPIVLDFSQVRDFYDFGVAVLAHGLAQRDAHLPPVRLRGLRTHQSRMFSYFGVEA